MSADVAVVGAGLAGLTCALRLEEDGLSVGRARGLRTRRRARAHRRVDGFLLDRGFQVLLTAYPEAQRVFEYERLDLRELYPGALVRAERSASTASPIRSAVRFDALASVRSPVGALR